MWKVAPKITICAGLTIAIGLGSSLPVEALIIIAILGIAFMVDVLLFHLDINRTALQWIVNNVHLTDEPLGESDAPESLKKLLRRGGGNKSDKL